MALRFAPLAEAAGRPNVVVDGSPTEGTVLTLTHWPGYPPPAGFGLEADLSTQMAFRYLEVLRSGRPLHGDASVVTTNHLDQDGVAGLFALVDPAGAFERRALLEDVASAGDFAVFRDRTAARLSMAIAAFADPERSPAAAAAGEAAELIGELLGRLPHWCDDPESVRDLWADEDAALAASERLFASGRVVVHERPEVDLAVVDVAGGVQPVGGHRFAHEWHAGLHPMAITMATGCFSVLTRQAARYRLWQRYETWVAYRSRALYLRRDLRPLAVALSDLEPGGVVWGADPPGSLEPVLEPVGGESGLDPEVVEAAVVAHLGSSPPEWDPFSPRPAA